nr:recombinase family protein [Bradyrhizobium japonicum]
MSSPPADDDSSPLNRGAESCATNSPLPLRPACETLRRTLGSCEDKYSIRSAVSYIRVSRPKQGRSGLGLEAQQAAIKAFYAQHGYSIEAEYREVETGKGC